MAITKKCNMCGKEHIINISDLAVAKWRSGALLQNVAPELSADDRELLISGICGKCYDIVFADEEE